MKSKKVLKGFDLYLIFTILSGVFLFGSLIWTAISGDAVYFVFGYPLAAISLLVASRQKYFAGLRYGRSQWRKINLCKRKCVCYTRKPLGAK